ncbi:unnamed protein product [Haemonchus placei]|uniref:Neur_chan_LBD domain-containing protein n=1 Tax=Haemonchus placei TaxID=6290 RepID=A0A0N4WQD7_HAEPC|nr:unnamed protein product [Haemonchus placei]
MTICTFNKRTHVSDACVEDLMTHAKNIRCPRQQALGHENRFIRKLDNPNRMFAVEKIWLNLALIFVVYALTSSYDEEEAFVGDFNVKIGNRRTVEELHIGGFLENSVRDNIDEEYDRTLELICHRGVARTAGNNQPRSESEKKAASTEAAEAGKPFARLFIIDTCCCLPESLGRSFIFGFIRDSNLDVDNQVLSITVLNGGDQDCRFNLTYRDDYNMRTPPRTTSFVVSKGMTEIPVPSWYGWQYDTPGMQVESGPNQLLTGASSCDVTVIANNYDQSTHQGDSFLGKQ